MHLNETDRHYIKANQSDKASFLPLTSNALKDKWIEKIKSKENREEDLVVRLPNKTRNSRSSWSMTSEPWQWSNRGPRSHAIQMKETRLSIGWDPSYKRSCQKSVF